MSGSNNGLFRGSLDDFRRSQTLDCPDTAPISEVIFSSPTLVDFVLEPDVFIYFISNNDLYYVGFDKENNGTIINSGSELVEAFGALTVIFTSEGLPRARMCSSVTNDCAATLALFHEDLMPFIDDAIVFRKSKQPLPGMLMYSICLYII